MARKQMTVHYRRLADPTGAYHDTSLQEAVRRALSDHHDGGPIKDRWSRRAWTVPPSLDDTYFLNLLQDQPTYFYGDLTRFNRGRMQLLLRQDPDQPSLAIHQTPAPAGTDLVDSIIHWMVINDHVLLLQSHGLTAHHLEQYLTWLLTERTNTIRRDGHVILDADFKAEDVGGSDMDVREIVVGGPVAIPISATEAPTLGIVETEEFRSLGVRKAWDKAVNVLRAVLGNEADVNELLDSVPKEAKLEVSVHIGYKGRGKKLSHAPLQRALRNLPEGEVSARGRDGKIVGKDIRLSHPVSILMNGSMLDEQDVVRALREAYNYFVGNGKIVP